MKILFLSSLYYPNIIGGAEISIKILAEELVKRNFKTVVITTSKKDHQEYINGVKVFYISHSNLFWFMESAKKIKIAKPIWHLLNLRNFINEKKIKKIIKNENPDIIHTSNIIGLSSGLWGLLKKENKPIIHTLMDYYPLCWKSTIYNKGKNCKKRCFSCLTLSYFMKYYSKNVDAVVGISNFILKKHLDYNYFKKALKLVIGLPINQNLKVLPKTMFNNPPVFAFVGLLSQTKGIELLLNSFIQRKDDSILLVIGRAKSEKYENFLKETYKNDKIKFTGFSDIKKYLPGIDALIIPSILNEPFGRVIIEAHSFGIPVIASSKGGMPELVKHGTTGLIFSPEIEGDLNKKIDYFVNNRDKILEMSPFCIENAKKYSINNIIDRYQKIYDALVKG